MIYKYVVHNRQNIIKMLNTIVLFAAVLELAMGRLKCGGTSVTIQYGPPHGRSLLTRSSTLAPPRFLFYYYGFSSGNSTADNYIKNVVVPAATTHFTNALQVYSIASNLALSSTACGTVPVPTSHNNPGVSSTDLIFYMTLDNTTGHGFVGTGGACEFDTLQGNPVAGIITINVENFYPLSFDAMLCTMIHEMTHVLGFTSSSFSRWRNSTGSLYSSSQLTQTVTVRGTTKTYLITPNVVAMSRAAFGCSTLIGMELEDQGSSTGTVGSHWDARIMFNEYITAHVWENAIYSTITLALLQDSGWYTVNYTTAQVPIFGRNAGCNFFSQQCITNGVSNFPNLFCTDSTSAPACDSFLLRKGYCNRVTYTAALPTYFQYFSNPDEGSLDEYPDYCPFNDGYGNGDCRGTSLEAAYTQSGSDEVIGSTSRCFISTLIQSPYYLTSTIAACYPVTNCTSTGATVKIGSQSIICPFTGGIKTVPGYSGNITCPSSNALCSDVPCMNGCRGAGNCVLGQCQCYKGFSGVDCANQCSTNCLTCNTISCLTCATGYSLVSGLCSSCPLTCLTCNATSCLTCVAGTLYSSLKGSCCALNCATCVNSVCSLCNTGYKLINGFCCFGNCTSCANNVCSSCISSFSLLNGVCCPTNCTTCTNGLCSACNSGYTLNKGYCCPSNCNNCTNGTCLACNAGYNLNKNTCYINNCTSITNGVCSACSIGYKLVSPFCCPNNCTTCTSGNCTVCNAGYKLTSGFCCPVNCTNCVRGICFSCVTGYTLSNVCYPSYCATFANGICTGCSTGYLLTNGICCPYNCSTCVNGICTVCNSGYNAVNGDCCPKNCSICSRGKCTQCLSGFALSTQGFCCAIGCSTCLNGVCSACGPGYTLTSGLCCPNNCMTCLNGLCTACNSGYTLNLGACS